MDGAQELQTERLLMRRWRSGDREPFAAINADERVMELMPGTLTRAESDAYIDSIEAHFDEHGFGLWALELRDGDDFVHPLARPAHLRRHVLYRLSAEAWLADRDTAAGSEHEAGA